MAGCLGVIEHLENEIAPKAIHRFSGAPFTSHLTGSVCGLSKDERYERLVQENTLTQLEKQRELLDRCDADGVFRVNGIRMTWYPPSDDSKEDYSVDHSLFIPVVFSGERFQCLRLEDENHEKYGVVQRWRIFLHCDILYIGVHA